jgi:hypothetical protein
MNPEKPLFSRVFSRTIGSQAVDEVLNDEKSKLTPNRARFKQLIVPVELEFTKHSEKSVDEAWNLKHRLGLTIDTLLNLGALAVAVKTVNPSLAIPYVLAIKALSALAIRGLCNAAIAYAFEK